ncbi:hypothetical protein PsalN5692_04001 (plasmid) [Piscirickettsia salmonis]|uniref:hypothetical protein n=1 Tax=Piscirickettsia salmonis TaxID=1238 RepID=UPI0012B6B9EE|nr:hypothetical protein [Piscirickettsia salmonis]QGP52492.1 hypothetical protein PsalN5692_04001 [Piscirickettsia salmonis]
MNIKELFKINAESAIPLIKEKLPNATYISALLFFRDKLIMSINNNYNKWPEKYVESDMSNDDVFIEISQKKLKSEKTATCFWNCVPHESKASLEIHQRRAQNGLHNGVTLLESAGNGYAFGINLCSDDKIKEDSFYSMILLKRNLFMGGLKKEGALKLINE